MDMKKCFLITPIGPERSEIRKRSDQLLQYIIQPVTMEQGYQLLRVDQSNTWPITPDILRNLIDADLVIADITDLNPNVMYELGIRHAFDKPVITLAERGRPLPFDIADMRITLYCLEGSEVEYSKLLLSNSIKLIGTGEVQSELPIRSAVDIKSFEKISERELTQPTSDSVGAYISVLKSIESRLTAVESKLDHPSGQSEKQFSRRIFIVHGHDGELKIDLARFLEKLEFEPIILHEQPDKGETIFSKLRDEMSDVGFAFIILSPDDVGGIASRTEELRARARQNVVFEHGLFCGQLGPSRICAIRKGDVEIPSDLHGVLYKTLPIGGNISSIAFDIVKELRAAGYIVDANKV
jgi:predicted nucleotide-binding protein